MKKLWLSVLTVLSLSIVASPVASAAIAPITADGFTQAFANKHDRTWSGGDQSTSYKAPNGKVYWLSGDTILSDGVSADGSYAGTVTMVSNRILLQNGDQFDNAMVNGGIAVPDPASHTADNQERYWAQGVFSDSGYLYLLCQRVIRDTTPGGIGFNLIGTELAKYSTNSAGKLTFIKMVSTPGTRANYAPTPTATQWAGDAVVSGGYIYIYGYSQAPSGNPDWAAHYSYVARVPVGQAEKVTSWRFYKKSTNQWVTSMASLSTAINSPDAILPTQVSSVRNISGKFVILHKPWNGLGSAVYSEVSTLPQGPYTQTKIFDSPEGTWEGKNYVTYAPMLHPEQVLGGAETGKILVSINWNGKDFWSDVLGNANIYKPRFYSLQLP